MPKLHSGLNVIRQTLSDWSSEADMGITVRNVDASQIERRRVEGFTIGMRTIGDGRGVEDSTFTLGRIVNNRIGLDIWCATATAWNTSIRYYGGHFAQATEVNAVVDRFYGLPEAAPAVLNGTPLLTGALFGSGRREFAAEAFWDLPRLAPGATSLIDVTVNGARAGDLAQASLVSSTRFIELDAAVWSNNTVRVMARNISAAAFDLAAATLSMGVARERYREPLERPDL